MPVSINRADALTLLKKYNKEPFHIMHALTLEGVIAWFADHLGYSAEKDFWATVGLLHDIDFELYPEEHCVRAPELLRGGSIGEDMIRAICSHGYGICVDIRPEHEMEKILFAADELTGLIGAAVRMRPSKSAADLEVSSLMKKFKDKKFAAGCSRDIIQQGADMLGWDLDKLVDLTIQAMRSCEESVNRGDGICLEDVTSSRGLRCRVRLLCEHAHMLKRRPLLCIVVGRGFPDAPKMTVSDFLRIPSFLLVISGVICNKQSIPLRRRL